MPVRQADWRFGLKGTDSIRTRGSLSAVMRLMPIWSHSELGQGVDPADVFATRNASLSRDSPTWPGLSETGNAVLSDE